MKHYIENNNKKSDNYNKLLTHKLWYAKRKTILQRDGYTCTVCGSKNELRVHHTFYYSPWVAPWMYPNESLITVCKKCHDDFHLHHEVKIKKLPNGKVKKQESQYFKKGKRSVGKTPKRTLNKIKHGRFYIYKLETNY